jgi:hypothetical protein
VKQLRNFQQIEQLRVPLQRNAIQLARLNGLVGRGTKFYDFETNTDVN